MNYSDNTACCPECWDRVRSLARGSYQRALLDGSEAISGRTLKGKAATYSGRYRTSAMGLVARVNASGAAVITERRDDHNRRVIVITCAHHDALPCEV